MLLVILGNFSGHRKLTEDADCDKGEMSSTNKNSPVTFTQLLQITMTRRTNETEKKKNFKPIPQKKFCFSRPMPIAYSFFFNHYCFELTVDCSHPEKINIYRFVLSK